VLIENRVADVNERFITAEESVQAGRPACFNVVKQQARFDRSMEIYNTATASRGLGATSKDAL
jgi:hypothetical protein